MQRSSDFAPRHAWVRPRLTLSNTAAMGKPPIPSTKVQKTYTAEFQRAAVPRAQTSGQAIAQVARELGISDPSIHQWRKELTEHGPQAFPGSGHQTAKARGSTLPQARIGNREGRRPVLSCGCACCVFA